MKSKPRQQRIRSVKGYVWRFGDNVSTDDIISGVHLASASIDEIKQYAFATLRPEFAKQVKVNDVVVGGRNFGIGSSREEAPAVLRALGVGAIIAASFARIFFRNAFNLGLPAVELPKLAEQPTLIKDNDQILLNLNEGTLLNFRSGQTLKVTQLPPFLLTYIIVGGAIPLLKQRLIND